MHVDASDVLQETYLEAFKQLPRYLRQQPMPLCLWLCWIAREKVLALHRRHLGAEKRAVTHETPLLPSDSSATFVSAVIAGREPSPSQALAKAELAERLRLALGQLDDNERDLILWRHFEQLRSPCFDIARAPTGDNTSRGALGSGNWATLSGSLSIRTRSDDNCAASR
jgi:RNA polymerase sigma factor (sigma-70 family)